MAADEPQISILDARLAEIDRRLRTIQTGLAVDAGSEPESEARFPPKIAVPEPGGPAPRPVAPAPSIGAAADSQAPAAPDEDPSLVIAALRGLISDQARLLDTMGELLTSGERLLAQATAAAREERQPAPPSAPASAAVSPAVSPPAVSQVSVTAGPFASLDAVRDFERALGMLPNVAAVDVRGYEGEDRAMVDVHLSPPNP